MIPEIRIKSLLDLILGMIEKDYTDAVDKSTTFLYALFGSFESGNYKFFDEAVRIFVRDSNDPRLLETRLLYDRERANIPTIHITFPPEDPSTEDGIGMDEGVFPVELDIDETGFNQFFCRSYSAKLDLKITGSNTFEVIVISNVLKAALINNVMTLQANGFQNIKVYHGDVLINTDIIPTAYMRNLFIDFHYTLKIPRFEKISVLNWEDVRFVGVAVK